MMPTFPRSPLSFRTAGFPQYGWKVGFPSGAFLDRRQLKPAPGIRCPPSSLPPLFVHLGVIAVIPHCVGPQTRLRTAMEGYYSSTPGVLARVRVIVSRSVITYATPSVPLMGTPRFHRKAAYTRCLRCAGAPRRDPRAVPGFRCSSLPDMPSSMTSGSSIIVSVQNTDVDIGLRHGPKSSALPIVPQSISRGPRFPRLHWFATATACQVAGPPCTDLTGLPATGGFYFQAFDGSVTLPVAGYNYNSVWTPLLAGLPPAGMAASLAALVRPCSSPASKRSWQGAPKTRSTPCLRHPIPRSP